MNKAIVFALLCAGLASAIRPIDFPATLAKAVTPGNITNFYARNIQADPHEASETIIVQNDVFPQYVAIESNYFGEEEWTTVVPGIYYSGDGGQTFKTSYFPELDQNQPLIKSLRDEDGSVGDPTLAWSADGTLLYSFILANCTFGCDMWFWTSKDFGATWTGPVIVESDNDYDKPMLHVDAWPTSPYKDNIYAIFDDVGNSNIIVAAVSKDKGKTWNLQTFANTGGIGGDVASDKKGVVYYVYPGLYSQANTINLWSSTDGGTTFNFVSIVSSLNVSFQLSLPAQSQRGVLAYTAIDVDMSGGQYDGNLYIVWTDTMNNGEDHGYIIVGHSKDGGKTWSKSTPHSMTDVYTVDRFFPWLSVDPKGTGRVHVSFYDTRHFADRSGVDVYYSFSDDGGVTWIDPIRLSSMSSWQVTWDFDQFGDYEGLSVRHNRVMPVWADNRNVVGPVTVWTAVMDVDMYDNCASFNVSYTVNPYPPAVGKPTTFTAVVSGGQSPYTYEWNFSESAKVDCSTASCTWTYTNTTVAQAALLVTESSTNACYRGATAFLIPH